MLQMQSIKKKELKVKFLGEDDFGRKVYQSITNKRFYKDTDCIHYTGQFYTSNSFDGEPDWPLSENEKIIVVNNVVTVKNDGDWILTISDPEQLITEDILGKLKKYDSVIYHNDLSSKLWIFDFKLENVWFESTKINAVKRTINLVIFQ